jgi:hypothetical protein
MNLRLGMARLARVTAVAYWIIAIGVAALAYSEEATEPVAPRVHRVQSPSGRILRVEAYDKAGAIAAAQAYAAEDPERVGGPPNRFDQFDDVVAYQGSRPTRVSPMAGLAGAGRALLWAVGIYLALWAVFRGIRWVALGFLDGSQSKEAKAERTDAP